MRTLDEVAIAAALRCDEAVARETAALRSLAALCAMIRRVGGFMPHSDQVALRAAEACLVENEKTK